MDTPQCRLSIESIVQLQTALRGFVDKSIQKLERLRVNLGFSRIRFEWKAGPPISVIKRVATKWGADCNSPPHRKERGKSNACPRATDNSRWKLLTKARYSRLKFQRRVPKSLEGRCGCIRLFITPIQQFAVADVKSDTVLSSKRSSQLRLPTLAVGVQVFARLCQFLCDAKLVVAFLGAPARIVIQPLGPISKGVPAFLEQRLELGNRSHPDHINLVFPQTA